VTAKIGVISNCDEDVLCSFHFFSVLDSTIKIIGTSPDLGKGSK
jgi:hypothetical protein